MIGRGVKPARRPESANDQFNCVDPQRYTCLKRGQRFRDESHCAGLEKG
jgi:hypothetical protein